MENLSLVELPSAGCVLGEPYPDWPEHLTSFAERKIYQLGVAHGKAVQRHEDALLIAQLQARLKEVSEGLDIVERNFTVAQNADPADAPFPLTGQEAALWHKASASAYQHALEMCNSQSLKAFVENGFNPVPDADAPVLTEGRPGIVRNT